MSIPKSVRTRVEEINKLIEWAKDKDDYVSGDFGSTVESYIEFKKPIRMKNQFVYIEYNLPYQNKVEKIRYNVNKKEGANSIEELKYELSELRKAFTKAKRKYDKYGYFKEGGEVEGEWVQGVYSGYKGHDDKNSALKKLEEFKKVKHYRNVRLEEVPYSWGTDYRIIYEYERRKMEKGGIIPEGWKKIDDENFRHETGWEIIDQFEEDDETGEDLYVLLDPDGHDAVGMMLPLPDAFEAWQDQKDEEFKKGGMTRSTHSINQDRRRLSQEPWEQDYLPKRKGSYYAKGGVISGEVIESFSGVGANSDSKYVITKEYGIGRQAIYYTLYDSTGGNNKILAQGEDLNEVNEVAERFKSVFSQGGSTYAGGGEVKRYSYYYDGQAIPKSRFLSAVPENWENDVDEYGEYSYGYYRAVEIVDSYSKGGSVRSTHSINQDRRRLSQEPWEQAYLPNRKGGFYARGGEISTYSDFQNNVVVKALKRKSDNSYEVIVMDYPSGNVKVEYPRTTNRVKFAKNYIEAIGKYTDGHLSQGAFTEWVKDNALDYGSLVEFAEKHNVEMPIYSKGGSTYEEGGSIDSKIDELKKEIKELEDGLDNPLIAQFKDVQKQTIAKLKAELKSLEAEAEKEVKKVEKDVEKVEKKAKVKAKSPDKSPEKPKKKKRGEGLGARKTNDIASEIHEKGKTNWAKARTFAGKVVKGEMTKAEAKKELLTFDAKGKKIEKKVEAKKTTSTRTRGKASKKSTSKKTTSTRTRGKAIKKSLSAHSEGGYSKRGKELDGAKQAKPAGKRISKDGNVYYEYRENKADATSGAKAGKRFKKGGQIPNRIARMIKSWKKNGYAFSNISNDDRKFYEELGLNYGEVGTTSQTGNDLVLYDFNRKSKYNK